MNFIIGMFFRTYFGNANFFGGPSVSSLKLSAKLKLQEDQNPDAMMVFLSDVWLDQTRVMNILSHFSYIRG